MGIFDRLRHEPPVPEVGPEPVTFYGGPAFRDVTLKALEITTPQALYKIKPEHYYLCGVDLADTGRLVVVRFGGDLDERGRPIFIAVDGFGAPVGRNDVIPILDLGTVEP